MRTRSFRNCVLLTFWKYCLSLAQVSNGNRGTVGCICRCNRSPFHLLKVALTLHIWIHEGGFFYDGKSRHYRPLPLSIFWQFLKKNVLQVLQLTGTYLRTKSTDRKDKWPNKSGGLDVGIRFCLSVKPLCAHQYTRITFKQKKIIHNIPLRCNTVLQLMVWEAGLQVVYSHLPKLHMVSLWLCCKRSKYIPSRLLSNCSLYEFERQRGFGTHTYRKMSCFNMMCSSSFHPGPALFWLCLHRSVHLRNDHQGVSSYLLLWKKKQPFKDFSQSLDTIIGTLNLVDKSVGVGVGSCHALSSRW